MPNLFQKARAWLPAQVEAAAGETVLYTRGVLSAELVAVPGQTAFVSNAIDAARVQFGDADFIVRVGELERIGLTPATPKNGDRITRTIDGQAVVFEMQDPGPGEPGAGEPAWRYSGPDRYAVRIHTKFVKVL